MQSWLMKYSFAALLFVTGFPSVLAAVDYPSLILENEKLRVFIYLPDARNGYYRGTRFDWSGIIERVEYAGHRFYAPLHQIHDPETHDAVSGPAEEFAMYHPMGFDEAAKGESFVKIGVGLLAKNAGSEYQFHEKYRIIRAGEWDIDHGDDWISFHQDFRGERGWAYRYSKTIRLLPGLAELVIEHRLENSGERVIDISNYNHNFTIIDDQAYGPDYSVEFAFATGQAQPMKEFAWFRDNRIEVDKPLGENALWLQVYAGDGPAELNTATIRNNKSGAAVKFQGDSPITRMVFWAVEAAVSAEPFIAIHLTPGQVQQWTSHYQYLVDTDS